MVIDHNSPHWQNGIDVSRPFWIISAYPYLVQPVGQHNVPGCGAWDQQVRVSCLVSTSYPTLRLSMMLGVAVRRKKYYLSDASPNSFKIELQVINLFKKKKELFVIVFVINFLAVIKTLNKFFPPNKSILISSISSGDHRYPLTNHVTLSYYHSTRTLRLVLFHYIEVQKQLSNVFHLVLISLSPVPINVPC